MSLAWVFRPGPPMRNRSVVCSSHFFRLLLWVCIAIVWSRGILIVVVDKPLSRNHCSYWSVYFTHEIRLLLAPHVAQKGFRVVSVMNTPRSEAPGTFSLSLMAIDFRANSPSSVFFPPLSPAQPLVPPIRPPLPGGQQDAAAGIAPAEKRTTVKFGLGMKKAGGKGGFRRR